MSQSDTNETKAPVLVLGGRGKTGRRVASRLEAAGVPVRIGSRSGTPPFDWEDSSTWGAALDGARAVYITYQPDLAVPGALETVRAFFAQALDKGVTRQVLLSGRGEEEAEAAEQALRESGAQWTVLRASWFAQNFSEDFLLDAVNEGTVMLPVGAVGEPFIDVEDIAEVAVAALTDPRHVGQLYELTGPRLMTFEQAVSEIGTASGREIGYVQITPEEFEGGLKQQGLPEEMVALVMYLFTQVLDGRNAQLADGVQRALGRAPRDFTEYAQGVAAQGVWAA